MLKSVRSMDPGQISLRGAISRTTVTECRGVVVEGSRIEDTTSVDEQAEQRNCHLEGSRRD